MDIPAIDIMSIRLFNVNELIAHCLNTGLSALREARMAQPATAENPNESDFARGHLRGVIDSQLVLNDIIARFESARAQLESRAPEPAAGRPARYRPQFLGLTRAPNEPCILHLALTDIPTDADVHSLHDFLKFWVPE